MKPPPVPNPKTQAELDAENSRRAEQVEAIETMTKMAKAHFGTTAGMLKQVKAEIGKFCYCMSYAPCNTF